MRVLLLSTTYFPHVGGLEQVVRQLGWELQRRGLSIFVATDRQPLRLAARSRDADLPIYRFPFTEFGLSVRGSLSFPLARLYTITSLRRLVRQHGVDLIHLHGLGRNVSYGVALSKSVGLPLVATAHGVEVESVLGGGLPPALERRQLRVLREAVTAAAVLTSCSSYLGAQLVRVVPEAGPKLTSIQSGVSLEEFTGPLLPTPGTPDEYILYVGRMVAKKGVDVLLRAFALLATERGSLPQLVLIGDGPERGRLEALANALGITGHVCWMGHVADRRAVAAMYRGAQLCVVPSRQEPLGIVCLEALAAGRKLVATAVGGIPEVVRDGVDGVLVPPDNPEVLAQAIVAQLQAAPPMTSDLWARAAEFAWPRLADQYIDVYNRALMQR